MTHARSMVVYQDIPEAQIKILKKKYFIDKQG